MSNKHYDVVVLGRSVGAMALAALLARRDFRVLVLGQGSRPSTYEFRGHPLRRRAFTLLSAASPAFRRIFTELAQSQVLRRRMVALDPMMSVLLPGRRFEVPPDLEIFQREADREFGEVRRVIDELYTELTRVNAAADTAFDKDLCWPPGTFWERRETNATATSLPHVRGNTRDILGDFPPNHPYAVLVTQTALFASHLAPSTRPIPPFALARLHGAWTRGVFAIPGGEDELTQFLAERITSLGGMVALDERAVALNVNPRGVHQLLLDGQLSSAGALYVVTDDTGESLAQLAQGKGLHRNAQRDWPLVSGRSARFVVSLVVHTAALPEPLGPEAFVFTRMPGAPPDPLSPVIHLQRFDKLVVKDSQESAPETTLLVAEILIPQPTNIAVTELRELVVGAVLAQFPFLQDHLVIVDSPHDGLPVWVYEQHQRVLVDRIETKGGLRTAEPMPTLVTVDPPGYLGIGGEPLRGPIPNTFLVGKSVLPALGQEGELLAAWGVARIITRSDKRRQRMRRDMWSRIEFG